MPLSGQAFVKEIQGMVQKKHSKDHPIIGMIENGELTREQLKGFHRTVLFVFSQTVSQTHRRHAQPLPG